jgi:hypothetical protein
MVWEALGDVPNYVEPFCGSAAVLLARPSDHRIRFETANDYDAMISNFYRAVAADPAGVAEHCDYPVFEADLHARHQHLTDLLRREWRDRMLREPHLFDAKVAGWWCWGLCAWIGSDWCAVRGDDDPDARLSQRVPHLSSMGQGVHGERLTRKMPSVGSSGVHAGSLSRRIPSVAALRGVHADQAGGGQESEDGEGGLYALFARLQRRLRRVQVACGSWERVLTPTVTWKRATPVGVFLDPPYGHGKMEYSAGGNVDTGIADRVRAWAIENGDDPRMRIVLAGYEGQHEMPGDWRVVEWKAQGGYGGGKGGEADANSHKETLWCSPHCLGARQPTLFGEMGLGPRVVPRRPEMPVTTAVHVAQIADAPAAVVEQERGDVS